VTRPIVRKLPYPPPVQHRAVNLPLDSELKRGRPAPLILARARLRQDGHRTPDAHLVAGIDNPHNVIHKERPLALEVVASLKLGPRRIAEVPDAGGHGVGVVQEGQQLGSLDREPVKLLVERNVAIDVGPLRQLIFGVEVDQAPLFYLDRSNPVLYPRELPLDGGAIRAGVVLEEVHALAQLRPRRRGSRDRCARPPHCRAGGGEDARPDSYQSRLRSWASVEATDAPFIRKVEGKMSTPLAHFGRSLRQRLTALLSHQPTCATVGTKSAAAVHRLHKLLHNQAACELDHDRHRYGAVEPAVDP
jgi:hypothetical protein